MSGQPRQTDEPVPGASPGAPRTWLTECYAPGLGPNAVADQADRIRTAIEIVRHRTGPVDYLGALLVAGDEAVFHAFAAAEEAPVAETCRRAGLRYARIVESIAVTAPGLVDALTRLLATTSPARTEDVTA